MRYKMSYVPGTNISLYVLTTKQECTCTTVFVHKIHILIIYVRTGNTLFFSLFVLAT